YRFHLNVFLKNISVYNTTSQAFIPIFYYYLMTKVFAFTKNKRLIFISLKPNRLFLLLIFT
ncbi:hypothetical protein ACJX0J_040975, partial [Zea mays]